MFLQVRLSHKHRYVTVIVAYAPTETARLQPSFSLYLPMICWWYLATGMLSLELTQLTNRPLDLSLLASPTTTLNVSSPSVDWMVCPFLAHGSRSQYPSLDVDISWRRHQERNRPHSSSSEDRGHIRTYRAYWGTEAPARTNHMLVAADLVFTVMKSKKTHEVRCLYDVDWLSSSSELQQHYCIKVQNKFDALGTFPDTSPASGSHCARPFGRRSHWPMKENSSTSVIRGHLQYHPT